MTDRRFKTIISVLGVVLTLASVIASIAQYRAADLQAKAAIAALMPQLEVRAVLEKVDSDVYTDRHLELTSDGGPIYNFSTDRITTFALKKGRTTFLEQPLIGYYAATDNTGRIKGEVQKIIGQRNHKKFTDLERAIELALPSDVTVSPLATLMKATYTDSLRKENDEYFLILGGSVQRLEQSEGKSQWERMKQVQTKVRHIDIDDMSKPDALYSWLATVRLLWESTK